MKRLKRFSYFEPTSLKEAAEILAEKNGAAYPLAGGTDLLVRMKRGEITPSAVVNLKRIQDLNRIRTETGKGTHIGALTTISAIEASSEIREGHPILAQAAGTLGSPSIRNLATLGGNIGRASPASDMAPPLIVVGARVTTEGLSGKKAFDIEEVFSGPGKTTLSAGEIITSFFLPDLPPRSGSVYLKLGRRVNSGDCALVGVAALVTVGENNTDAKAVRIALSSVGPAPIRAKNAEKLILSEGLTEERIREAGSVASEEATPITDMRCSASYRKEMVKVLTFRALQTALQIAQGGETN